MSQVELSVQASTDLLDIYLFGLRVFGPTQADRYLAELEACFGLLARNPRMGRRAEAVGPGLRRYEHASHVIFFEAINGGVRIVTLMHSRRIPILPPE